MCSARSLQNQSGAEEELIDVTQSPTIQSHEMSAELPEAQPSPTSIEDKVKAVQEKLSTLEKNSPDTMTLDSIKDKLEVNAEKKASD